MVVEKMVLYGIVVTCVVGLACSDILQSTLIEIGKAVDFGKLGTIGKTDGETETES